MQDSTKRHFRVTGSVAELMEHPERSIILAAVLVAGFVSFQVSQTYLQPASSQNEARVLGQTITDEPAEQSARVDAYRAAVKSEVSMYLAKRAEYQVASKSRSLNESGRAKWLQELQDTRRAILDLRVPVAYQEVHLELAILLAAEERLLNTGAQGIETSEESTGEAWAKLLEEYQWLNN